MNELWWLFGEYGEMDRYSIEIESNILEEQGGINSPSSKAENSFLSFLDCFSQTRK